jgi:hypothetical protein
MMIEAVKRISQPGPVPFGGASAARQGATSPADSWNSGSIALETAGPHARALTTHRSMSDFPHDAPW